MLEWHNSTAIPEDAMARDEYLFTSESVTEGHPDKIADQISDAVLDAIIGQDPTGRVACECLLTTGLVVVAGEITTSCYVDIPRIARDTIRDVGYTRAKFGFDYETCGIIAAIDEQSSDIAMGVDALGAGDQGLMFGYACTETPELMPLPIMLAHTLVRRLAEVRRKGVLDYLRPDGKSQVTVRYVDGKPRAVETVVVSCQHSPDVTTERLRAEIVEHVIVPTVPPELLDQKTCVFHVNPTGRFVTAGRWATRGSPDARSSSTRTAGRARTAAARSRERTRPRWIGRRATWRATSPRTSSRRASRPARRSRSRTRSASPIRSRSWSTRSGRARCRTRSSRS